MSLEEGECEVGLIKEGGRKEECSEARGWHELQGVVQSVNVSVRCGAASSERWLQCRSCPARRSRGSRRRTQGLQQQQQQQRRRVSCTPEPHRTESATHEITSYRRVALTGLDVLLLIIAVALRGVVEWRERGVQRAGAVLVEIIIALARLRPKSPGDPGPSLLGTTTAPRFSKSY
jgi:hypothetical protein